MKSLKSIVYSNLGRLMAIMMIAILFMALVLQILTAQHQARENAQAAFLQVEQILEENKAELTKIEHDYRETCLSNAEAISYIIQHHPDILENVEEFRQLAKMMQVDEIHIFDDTGRIFTGTHPEYFDFTFDSGEQMNFFKPMLKNKRLRLCQDITPNTAEGKLVQYSALWSSDWKFIVQVGMYPDTVLETTEKNELSYIFSMLQGSHGVSFYAINLVTGEIVGSTSKSDNGKYLTQVGFRRSDIDECPKGVHLRINGVDSYGIFENMASTVIGYIVSTDELYNTVIPYTMMLAVYLLIIAAMLAWVVRKFTKHYIIDSIYNTNKRLRAVSEGDLNERVDVKSSLEFSELSEHINNMIQTLLASTDKMSFVLDRTNMKIGVYEYNSAMKTVRFTEHIPGIFGLSKQEMNVLSGDYLKMKEFIDKIRQNNVENMENTYRFMGKQEVYLKLEEVSNGHDVLGVVVDVTGEARQLRMAETERDFDLLTGLYNRRGMERRLSALFADAENLRCGAMIMIDSDDMKNVNDTYGHSAGDKYLQFQAEILKSVPAPHSVAARIGGDEFVLFAYGYASDEEVNDAISYLRQKQDSEIMVLDNTNGIPMKFSFGYQIIKNSSDYTAMIMAADEYMYASKRIRKKLAHQNFEENGQGERHE